MFISITMILMTFEVFKSSIKTLINGEKFTFSIWLIVVCLVTIIIKFSLNRDEPIIIPNEPNWETIPDCYLNNSN